MDAGEVAGSEVGPEVLEQALKLAREQRDEFILWMSVEVLMTDSVATADEVLVGRLSVVQDRIENMLRARYSMTDRDAKRGQEHGMLALQPDALIRDREDEGEA